jgi:translation initiation factor IF-2
MTEQKEENKSTKPLSLSTASRSGAAAKADANQVRQKFSHGRTRSVTVEVKKPVKRPPGAAPAAAAPAPAPQAPAPQAAPAAPTARTLKLGGAAAPAPRAPAAPAPRPASPVNNRGIVLKTLTEEEKEARARALVGADRDAVIAREKAAVESARRAAEEKARKIADEEHKKRLAE